MNPQQLLDFIIRPTLSAMAGKYDSIESRYLMLCTAAIESNCGYCIKQIGGPALGPWQMEPATHEDIWTNCDVLKGYNSTPVRRVVYGLAPMGKCGDEALTASPMYACAMARLKYAMDSKRLPLYTGKPDLDIPAFYEYYKRVYNTEGGASTFDKWCKALNDNGIAKVDLGTV